MKRFMHFLLKTEPGDYAFADLERDGSTVWTGVANPAAVKNLREMKKGDKLVIYHTGEERQAVGTAVVSEVHIEGPKTPLVTIKAGAALSRPHGLAEIKQHPLFSESPLVRQARLSVVPLTASQYEWLVQS